MVKRNQRTLLAAACILMLALSAGCAAFSSLTAKQEPLEERVKNYLQAMVDRKWDLAYSFFDASSRERITREGYVNRDRKLSYKGYGIEEIAVLPSGKQATVKVKFVISVMGYDFKDAPQIQNWVRERGGWFVKYETQSLKNAFTPQQEKQK